MIFLLNKKIEMLFQDICIDALKKLTLKINFKQEKKKLITNNYLYAYKNV